MTTEAFQQNSFDWQARLLSQRFAEWLEVRFANSQLPAVPDWNVSPNLIVTLCWLILAAIALWLIWQMVNLLVPQFARPRSLRLRPAVADRSSAADWLRQAQQQQQQGNYPEACRSLYLAMLQRLDETQKIPIADSRTDGEYWQCVRQLPQPQLYQLLIQTHEQVCFGTQPMTIENFRSCQQAYEQIDRSLDPT